jgi:hypothetical protein
MELPQKQGCKKGHIHMEQKHLFEIKIDDEPKPVHEPELSEQTLIELGGHDPERHYLVLEHGYGHDARRIGEGEVVKLHDGMSFLIVDKETKLEIEVDDEPVFPPKDEMTAKELIEFLKLDPSSHYLLMKRGKGHEPKSFEKCPEQIIKFCHKLCFVTVRCGSTPLS